MGKVRGCINKQNGVMRFSLVERMSNLDSTEKINSADAQKECENKNGVELIIIDAQNKTHAEFIES